MSSPAALDLLDHLGFDRADPTEVSAPATRSRWALDWSDLSPRLAALLLRGGPPEDWSESHGCPACGSDRIRPIIYGLPGSRTLLDDADAGHVVLGGCCRDFEKFDCATCGHQW